MTNNDILRRIRYIFDFADVKVIALFALAEQPVTREQVSAWLLREDEPGYENCSDKMLALFLNGLIAEKRGKREGPQPPPEKRLNNNIILRKLKIALELKDSDILEIMSSTGLHISKPELSAFFRRPEHKHYRLCKDQILRNFLKGLQMRCRPESDE